MYRWAVNVAWQAPDSSEKRPKCLGEGRNQSAQQGGKNADEFGPNPQGQVIFDPAGRFSLILTRSDVPRFASNNREEGTAEENQAAVRGSFAYFGTYMVSETDKVIIFHVEGSTYPNYKGTDQKRPFQISGDELTWTVSTPSVGSGTVYSVLKRAR